SQIWVAAGTYFPDRGTGQVRRDRTSTFRLKNGVALFGGFPSGGSPFEQRDPAAEPTILSGNIGSSSSKTDNSYHVLTGTGIDRSACVDGFTITGGYARQANSPDDKGGALICHNSGSPTISNCLFVANEAADEGGAIYSSDASRLLVTDSVFRENLATSAGGAVSNFTSIAEFIGCQFIDNRAEFAGAFYNAYSQTVATNCSFQGNEADYGGAVYNFDFRSLEDPTFIQCDFVGNRASWGGAMYGWSSSPILRNCCFHGNEAIRGGGALLSTNGWGAYLYNSIIWNNLAAGASDSSSATLALYSDSEFFAYNSLVANSGGSGNWNPNFYADRGGNIDADPLFLLEVDPSQAPTTGGDLRLLPGSPAIGAGHNDLIATGVETDQRGAPRIVGDTVDMGVFENLPELITGSSSAEYQPELSVKIEIAQLLATISGGAGLPLSITSVSTVDNPGSSVRISGRYIVYTPAAGQLGNGQFTFVATDGFQEVEGTVAVSPRRDGGAAGSNITSVTVVGGTATIQAVGIPGRTYQLQCSPDLHDWTNRGENQICPAGGVMEFLDPGPLPETCYYRLIHSSGAID
ncbi:MAG: choice-of-anchor Q domain-containing protein, partial [Verrucomicrobiales bacterium]